MSRAASRPVLIGLIVVGLLSSVFAVAGPLSPPDGPITPTSTSLTDLKNSIAGIATAKTTAGPADTSSTPGSAVDGRPLAVPDGPGVFVRLEVNGHVTGLWRIADLGRSVQVIEFRDGSDPNNATPLPGVNALPALTLVRELTPDASAFNWFQMVVQGDVAEARANGVLTFQDGDGAIIAQWSLTRAWPLAYDTRCDGASCAEQLTITMEHMSRVQ